MTSSVSRHRQSRTLTKCFKHFGAICSNRFLSLSAISNDGQTVVVAMWEDEFGREGDHLTYQSRYRPYFKRRQRLIANLKWARDHCGGLVRVIVVRAADVQTNPREIKSCYPDDDLIMRITHLDTRTGVFRAVSLDEIPNLVG
jgi:hypothetical protein